MMVVKIYIALDDQEAKALTKLAERELRYPKEQIRLFIREGLQRCGLLPKTHPLPEAESQEVPAT